MKTKKMILTMAIGVGALGIFAPRGAMAQGTVYVSNTGESSIGDSAIDSGQWLAAEFTTGGDSAGYTFDAIQFLSGAGNGLGGFSLSLYSDSDGQPETLLQQLSGTDNPVSDGTIYDYTASGVFLSPSTAYWVVASVASSSQGSYGWERSSDNYISQDGWSLGGIDSTPDGGSSWDSLSYLDELFQFGVTAAPVPEPQTFALAGLGLAALFLSRKK